MVSNTLIHETIQGFKVYRYDSHGENVSTYYVQYPNGDINSRDVKTREEAIEAAERWSAARAAKQQS